MQALPENERYRIRLLSNPAHHWQRRSLTALIAFGGELVTLEG